jgi:hypothetical protein
LIGAFRRSIIGHADTPSVTEDFRRRTRALLTRRRFLLTLAAAAAACSDRPRMMQVPLAVSGMI